MDKITFTVNGDRYTLSGAEVDLQTSLNDYLRNHLQLYGTKAMCHEGGCGVCVVSVTKTHPVTKEKHVFAVNSCLVYILSCHNWDIKTVEGVGNRKDGYNPIQTTLAAFNGSQCGYCTPGWVMNMYSLQQSNCKLTTKQVENSFGGNLCRCTGYRPILDTFKTFASEVEPELQNKLQDLEDLHLTKCAKKCTRKCSFEEDGWCLIDDKSEPMITINANDGKWYRANTLQDVFSILSHDRAASYKLVSGNTGKGIILSSEECRKKRQTEKYADDITAREEKLEIKPCTIPSGQPNIGRGLCPVVDCGVYPESVKPQIFIDISPIESLKTVYSDQNLVFGAGMTLTDTMINFQERSKEATEFKYLNILYKHLDLVAHVPVRNVGTIGGNLALKNQHHEFPSDVFLLLETVGATVTLVNKDLARTELKLHEFLTTDIKGKIITEVKLPPLSDNCHLLTYKIMPRAQNAHAIVNAGFLFKVDTAGIITFAKLVFGNISPTFVRASRTESALVGKKFNNIGLRTGLNELDKELVPKNNAPDPSPECRKMLALGLFYKAMLSLAPTVDPRFKSGGTILSRGISRGTQTYDTDKTLWPLNKPVPKMEGLTQSAGEVKYVCDINSGPREVHVAFVLSKVCRAQLLGFDTTEALKLPGVISFFSAKDIPGRNTFTPMEVPWMADTEEIFASSTISYYGQPLGIIVATNKNLALTAAALVRVNYKKLNVKPVLTPQDALLAPDKDKRIRQDIKIDAQRRGTDIKHVFSGSFTVPSQYHFAMETQSCYVNIIDSIVVVRSATQWMDLINVAVAKALDVDDNRVHVDVPRVGGSYGAKASRSAWIACACAIAAYKLNRPASLVLPITDNMIAIGKRHRCDFVYECGVNDAGVIQYLKVTFYSDVGCSYNDSPTSDLANTLTKLYLSDTFNITGYSVLTDKSSETWCRAPGTTEALAFTEHIMERISHITSVDHIDVRIANLRPDQDVVKDLIASFKMDTDFEDRRNAITAFNNKNAWNKKSLKLSLISYPIQYSWNFPVTISVYHSDGTIAISHGGIEMGQGINTKIAQVCAHSLKVPLEKIAMRGSDSFVSPNAFVSNGSLTSDSVAFATIKACENLLKALEPIKKKMNEPTWEGLIKKAYESGINLQATYMMSPKDGLVGYNVYGICAAEVELDVLTGNHMIRRLDILEDTGISMSPEIDVGQIEGAFVMGLGLWTSEEVKYDKISGRLLTDRTWTYKPPGAKDIPEDFRVKFRPNSSNPAGVLRSKATGEPALTLSVVVTHALHDAILEARKEFGYVDKDWVYIDTPYSVENILKAISPKIQSYVLTK